MHCGRILVSKSVNVEVERLIPFARPEITLNHAKLANADA